MPDVVYLPQVFSLLMHSYELLARRGDLVLARRTNARITFEVARVTITPAHTDAAGIDVPATELYPVEAALGTSLWRFDTSHAATRYLLALS